MSCEPASKEVTDVEYPYYGAGADISGAHSLSFNNPVAIVHNFEIQVALTGENDENQREKAAMTSLRASNATVPKKTWRPKKTDKIELKTCSCEWAVILTVIAVIWGLLALPTVYYRTLQNHAASSDPVNNTNASQCIPENYTGSVCTSALTAQQKCVPDRCGSTEIYVRMSANQEDVESQVSLLLNSLQRLNPSPECGEVVEPFLCFYYFGLCDSSGELYRPSAGECETLTTQTCAREFQIAVSILGNASLPQCSTLPPSETDCNGVCGDSECNGTEVGSGSGDLRGTNCTLTMANDTMIELLVPFEDQSDNSTESPMASPVTCREGFYLDDEIGLCLPECSKWESLPHHVELTTHVIVILSAVVYVVSASIFLLLSCLHYKRMFKFPSVFIVYQMFPLGLFEIFVLIAFTDRERLFCSQRDVPGSLEDSSIFCNFQGAVFHYMSLQEILLWLFHILAIFCGIKFPVRARIFQKNGYHRYAHFIMLGIAIVLPVVSIAVVQSTGGSVLATFPPFQCYARSTDAIYYTLILPGSIMLGTGITLVILIFHIIIHATELRRKSLHRTHTAVSIQGSWCSKLHAHIRRVLRLHSGEVKVLIISCYFTIFSVFIVTTFTLHKLQNLEQLLNDITNYFVCEATGTLRDCDKPSVELHRRIVSIVTFVLIGLFPIVNMVYVLNIRELKQKISKCFPKSKRQITSSSNGTASSVITQRPYLSSE